MKNGPLFLLGLFAALTVSWLGIVLGTHAQLGGLTPYYDQTEENTFPQPPAGLAAQGELVYRDLGCAACHTQQVRRPGYGSDTARGWGERQSVARDYIFQARPQLGASRFGPDLANFGGRPSGAPAPADLMRFLYAGSAAHPTYAFLFDEKKLVGERSASALALDGRLAPRRSHQIVPTRRAEALVAYLTSLKQGYEYPEARPLVEEKPAAAAASPAPAASAPTPPAPAPASAPNAQPPPDPEKANPPEKRPEQAVPAAAPDEKKKQVPHS